MADIPEMPRLHSAAGAVHIEFVEVARNVARIVSELVGILALHERIDICYALAGHGVERQSGLKLHPRFFGAP